MKKVYLLSDVARLFKKRPHVIAYAISSGLVPEPKLRIGNKRIFVQEDIGRLAAHFDIAYDLDEHSPAKGKEAPCPSS
jgi:hypothetical protein